MDQGPLHNTVNLADDIEEIRSLWIGTHEDYVNGIFKIGAKLIALKEQHGESLRQMADRLPFEWSTASRLMIIAKSMVVPPGKQASLPPHWAILYELAKLPDDIRNQALADGRIHPNMSREDAFKLVPGGGIEPPHKGSRVNTPPGVTISELIRKGEKLGLPTHAAAKHVGLSILGYRFGRDIVLLADNPNLDEEDARRCRDALQMMDDTCLIQKPHKMIEDIASKVWGKKKGLRTAQTAARITEKFEHAIIVIRGACECNLTIPHLSKEKATELHNDLLHAREALNNLIEQLREKTK